LAFTRTTPWTKPAATSGPIRIVLPTRREQEAMPQYAGLILTLEQLVQSELSGWPDEWVGFTWPGYTCQHTLRVRCLGLALADRLGANREIVALAALLHDMGKPIGEPHSHTGADRADVILSEMGVPAAAREAVCAIIRSHLDKSAVHSTEALILYDADFVDANFGYVALARYITIRAHRQQDVEEMTAAATEWLQGMEEKLAQTFTEPGRVIAEQRYARMRSFLAQLQADLRDRDDTPGWALGLARFLAGDSHRPNLTRQLAVIEGCGSNPASHLQACASVSQFARVLRDEIEGRG